MSDARHDALAEIYRLLTPLCDGERNGAAFGMASQARAIANDVVLWDVTESLADSHASLAEVSDPAQHSAIASCECGTAQAYRAARAALKGTP